MAEEQRSADDPTLRGQSGPRLLERLEEAGQETGRLLRACDALKTESEHHREEITRRLEARFEESRDRLLLASVGVMASLDKAIAVARATEESEPLVEGLVLVRTLLVGINREHDLALVPVLGLPPDPATCWVVGTRPVEDPEQHDLVVEVVTPAIRIGEKVAQRAQVAVGVFTEPAPPPPPPAEPEEIPPPAPPEPEPPAAAVEEALESTLIDTTHLEIAPPPVIEAPQPTPPPPAPVPVPVAAPPLDEEFDVVIPPEAPEPPPPVPVAEPAVALLPAAEPAIAAPIAELPVAPRPTPAHKPATGVWLAAVTMVVAGAVVLGGALFYISRPATGPARPIPPSLPPQTAITAPPAITPSTEVEAPSSPAAEATPDVAEPQPTPILASAPPTARPPQPKETAAPRPPEEAPAARAGRLASEGDKAYAEHRFDDALTLYEATLKLDPQNEAASTGRTRAGAAREIARRTFVVATTSIESGGAAAKGPSGFDASDIDAKKPPKDTGTFSIDLDPRPRAPGDAFTARLALTNLGKKALKIESLSVETVANTGRSGGKVSSRVGEIAAGKKAVVYELAGLWAEGTTAWRLEVTLVTSRGDTLRTQVAWK